MSGFAIVEVGQFVPLANGKLTTCELRLAIGLTDRVEVERPVWEGQKMIAWRKIYCGVAAKIELEDSRIVLGESLDLRTGDRFVDQHGAIYKLNRYEATKRNDKLPVAYVQCGIEPRRHRDTEEGKN